MVGVAQLVERWIVIPVVVGSIPIVHPIFNTKGALIARSGAFCFLVRPDPVWVFDPVDPVMIRSVNALDWLAPRHPACLMARQRCLGPWRQYLLQAALAIRWFRPNKS